MKSAKVLFLIVQGDGTANTVIVEGEAEWAAIPGAPAPPWTAKVPNVGVFAGKPGPSKLRLNPNPNMNRVRGIAHGIAIHPAQLIPGSNPQRFNPPQIEDLTWCVELQLT